MLSFLMCLELSKAFSLFVHLYSKDLSMKKTILFLCVFLVVGGLAFIGQESLFNEQDIVQPKASDVIKVEVDKPVALNQSTTSDTVVAPSEISSEQALSAMTELQKEKYQNLSDTNRTEMIEVISATDETSDTVSIGARKYFDLVNDDKKFEKLDADVEEKIAHLKLLPKDNQRNTSTGSN